ncbi:MAG: hypothetical protein NZ922_06990 [Candidatus Methanomethyliaceae archaeon]|nr:hypothetical protein [Candidatus Methanomethyliaceae archaeon]MDW7971562.1 dolichol kinase [Nitrososphaerota archaeon]
MIDMPLGFHYENLVHKNPLNEMLIGILLFLYVIIVVLGTKYSYKIFRKHGMTHNVAVYYNRKIIHVFAGGIIIFLLPIFFTAATIPLILVSIIALIVYIPHKRNKLLNWFQVEENMYEVNFVIAWGLAIGISWIFLNDLIYGILPAAFMSFGDAVTGVVRNALFKRRTKHWLGNLAMLIVCLPIGIHYAGFAGALAAITASIIEQIEFGPIDDNMLITISTIIVLILLRGI